jgi:NADH-quinone oxidoreductase subunit M
MQQIADLKTPEILAAGLLVVGIVLFGLWPAPMIELSAATITQMHQQISQRLL